MSHTPPANPPRHIPRQGRYPVRIPIRMTHDERALIGQRATALHLSISRYLVDLATRSKAPLFPEDKQRLAFLRALFAGASEKVQAALASERLAQGGEEMARARVCLQEVLRLLEAIGKELGRRLA